MDLKAHFSMGGATHADRGSIDKIEQLIGPEE